MFGSEPENDEEKDKKVAKGFEKFLKKTRNKPFTPEATEPAEDKQTKESKSEESQREKEKKKMKRDEDDDELSEEEQEPKKEEKKKEESDAKKQLKNFFMQPNGGGPKWENVGLCAALLGAFGYYMASREAPSEEITYMDFVNQYLAQN
jgi:hypothetical protein